LKKKTIFGTGKKKREIPSSYKGMRTTEEPVEAKKPSRLHKGKNDPHCASRGGGRKK